MINSKDIAPGATVYTARRGLQAHHDVLFEVEEHVVVKRTSCGYKVAHRAYTHGRLLLDADYYVSTSKEEVTKALMADADAQVKQLQEQVERMVAVKLKLSVNCLPASCTHPEIKHEPDYRICAHCGKEWPV